MVPGLSFFAARGAVGGISRATNRLAGSRLGRTLGPLRAARPADGVRLVRRALGSVAVLVQAARGGIQGGSEVSPFHARLLDLAHDAVVVRDSQGRITYWNHGATETYGWTADEAIGQDIVALLSSTYPVPFETIARTLAEHGAWDGELVQRRRDGSELVVESRWATVQEAGATAPSILEVSRDVTSRRRAEQALESAYDQIEETLLRANELAVMAQVADLAKSELLANMSHEIRTPMNGVMGVAELLLDTPLDARQREYVGMIQISAEALLTVINDILDFSKIEAGRLEMERLPCDVRVVVGGARSLVAQAASQKGLALTVDVAPDVPDALIGDPNRLRQILLNLLSNAVKFTSEGEVGMMVRVADADDQGTLLRFDVRDTGVGIEPEALGRLFQSFEQASEATAREYGGTGLGLAISKRLSEMMDGEIGVESVVGVGSTFWFTARFVHGCAVGEVERRSRPDAARPPVVLPRVLVAEDAPINQRVTVAMLEKLGYQADVVPNGREAIEQLGRARYGLVLMDCRMPTMDGYEATAAIRQAEQTAGGSQRIPIIALTASAVLGVREGCITAGMDDYLTKPLKSDDLDRVLGRWVTPEVVGEPATNQGPADSAPTDEAAPVLDPDNVAQLGELGADVLAELAGIFLGEAPELQHEIQESVERADPVQLQFLAHRLRSEVRTWGAHRLDRVLERLEEIGDAGSTDGAPDLLPELAEAAAEVVAALERLLHPDL